MSQCRACGNTLSATDVFVEFGVWDFSLSQKDTPKTPLKVHTENLVPASSHLVRKTQKYPLAACLHCTLVQMDTEYSTDLITTLYFHSTQESVMWHEALIDSKQPYHEATRWVLEHLPSACNTQIICDFGCANGDLLQAFATELSTVSSGLPALSSLLVPREFQSSQDATNSLKNNTKEVTLIGVDFNDRCDNESIQYFAKDLNNLSHIQQILVETKPDVICLSHTLEHVLDPLGVCRSIAENMLDDAVLFIEVPDFSDVLPNHLAGRSNLVNMQHVQYFSLASLALLLQAAGLTIIQYQQITTGYIPRLQVLVQRASTTDIDSTPKKISQYTLTPQEITSDIISAVKGNLRVSKTLREQLLTQISFNVSQQKRTYLWGIGADFYALSQLNNAAILQSEWVYLVDYELAGKYWQGKEIYSSSILMNLPKNTDHVIQLVPILAETRYKMHRVADTNNITVVDSFAENLLAVPLSEKMSCQVCQNQNFIYIDTLYSGVWETHEIEQGTSKKAHLENTTHDTRHSSNASTQALVRNELSFSIEQCQTCQHVQVTSPYSEERFNQLYFSDTAEPNMWPDLSGQPSPYTQMVEMLLPYLTSGQHVADFGCGVGALLSELAKTVPDLRLTGVDFIHHKPLVDVCTLSCDLNNTAELHKIGQQVFDVVMSSHVLEHVLAPVAYLRALRWCLKDHGVCFIEVPDASLLDLSVSSSSLRDITQVKDVSKNNIDYAMTNLVHGQHIHYFSLLSLTNIVRFAGFKIIQTRQLLTGDIPRLQMVLEKATADRYLPKITDVNATAYPIVKRRFTQYQNKLERQYEHILTLLNDTEIIGLWGIGGDVCRLFGEFPELAELLGNGRIVLFDHTHKGTQWQGSLIHDSQALTNFNHPVVLGPFYIPTLSSMLAVANNIGIEKNITSCLI